MSESPVDALRRSITPLAGHDPDLGDEDLQPFLDAVGDARLVGLGESTHGTREIFRLKDRCIRALVRSRQLDLVVFEANAPETRELDRYVAGEDVDPGEALAGIRFWVWDTEEVLELLHWLRARNQATDGPRVRVAGCDVQFPPLAVANLLLLAPLLPDAFARAQGALDLVGDDAALARFTRLAPDVRRDAAEQLAEFVDAVDEAGPSLVATYGQDLAEEFAVDARVVAAGAALRVDMTRAVAVRDRAMADLTLRFLGGSRTTAALWAHNGHVGRVPFDASGEPAQGGHLATALGDDYHVVGFTVGGGEAHLLDRTTWQPGPQALPPLPPEGLDATVGRTGVGLGLLDLHDPDPEVASWFATRPVQLLVGAVLDDERHHDLLALDPREAYDQLVHVHDSTAARGRPSTRRGGSRDAEVQSAVAGPADTAAWSTVTAGPADAYDVIFGDELVVERRAGTARWGSQRVVQAARVGPGVPVEAHAVVDGVFDTVGRVALTAIADDDTELAGQDHHVRGEGTLHGRLVTPGETAVVIITWELSGPGRLEVRDVRAGMPLQEIA